MNYSIMSRFWFLFSQLFAHGFSAFKIW